jgi:hypothetical protein
MSTDPRGQAVRRKARRQGYMLRKSRIDGTWLVIDPEHNGIVAGGESAQSDGTNGWLLEDVEAWLALVNGRRPLSPHRSTARATSQFDRPSVGHDGGDGEVGPAPGSASTSPSTTRRRANAALTESLGRARTGHHNKVARGRESAAQPDCADGAGHASTGRV